MLRTFNILIQREYCAKIVFSRLWLGEVCSNTERYILEMRLPGTHLFALYSKKVFETIQFNKWLSGFNRWFSRFCKQFV